MRVPCLLIFRVSLGEAGICSMLHDLASSFHLFDSNCQIVDTDLAPPPPFTCTKCEKKLHERVYVVAQDLISPNQAYCSYKHHCSLLHNKLDPANHDSIYTNLYAVGPGHLNDENGPLVKQGAVLIHHPDRSENFPIGSTHS